MTKLPTSAPSTTNEIDAVTISVLWSSLVAITEEMGTALRNSAYSVAVREGDDFSTGLFDRHGRLVAQGNFTPGHLGAMPYVLENIERYFPRKGMRPGDGFLLNDSQLGSGHFPDCFLVTPIHDHDELIGYSATIAHQVDVGGAAPGSQMVHGVTEAFQEGIRILPTKIMANGQFDENVLRLVLGNVRMPEVMMGDITAQRNANDSGGQQFLDLYRRYGADDFDATVSLILERTEADMRERLLKLPQGVYSFADYLDDCGPGTDPICIAVDIRIEGGDIFLDFSRSSDQVDAAINSYINYTRAYSFFAIKVLTQARLPQNAGSIAPISVQSREGSFMNPRFPASSGGRATVQVRIFEVINGALAQAIPDLVLAGFSHWSNPNIGGTDPSTGQPFVYYDLIMGGYGATSARDGVEAMAPVMNCANVPVEMHELTCPVRISRFEFIPDSGGPGQYRGGNGVRKDVELLAPKGRLSLLSDRHIYPPYGLNEGMDGKTGQTILIRNGSSTALSSKQVVNLQAGDVISFRVSGAGGHGNPALRSPEMIFRDIEAGYCSAEKAAQIYGYVPATHHVAAGDSHEVSTKLDD